MQRALASESFFERARARLNLEVPAALTDHAAPTTRGDLDLDPTLWERAGVAATRPAAVLVPVVDHPEPTILLTLRTAELPSHAGQSAPVTTPRIASGQASRPSPRLPAAATPLPLLGMAGLASLLAGWRVGRQIRCRDFGKRNSRN